MTAFTSQKRTPLVRPRVARGFTLLELVIVMAIIVVTTVIAVPVATSTMNAYYVNNAVTSLTGAVQTTRYQAISNGYPFELTVSSSSSTYQVWSDPGRTGTFAKVGNSIPFSSKLNVLGQDTLLVFRPGGAVCLNTSVACFCPTNASGWCQMSITYRTNPTEVITVSPYGQTSVAP